MIRSRFLGDTTARIPFSVIGVFLILGSSIAAVNIARMEQSKSQEIARSLDFSEVDVLLKAAEADCATALNTAGVKALLDLGKHPVVSTSFGTPGLVSELWVKKAVCRDFAVYLTGHYLYHQFSNGRYAIDIVPWNDAEVITAENISLSVCPMQLNRTTIPLLGPAAVVNHSTYWIASVPLTFSIWSREGDGWVCLATRDVVVSTILTSRYPLLESLMQEFERTVNGSLSPLWIYLTVCSNLYALLRGLKHYSQGRPENVVDNRHLAVLLNSGLLLEQGLVFGSVDPLGLVGLARHFKSMLQQTPQDALTTFNEEMKGDGYQMDTESMAKHSANADAGCPLNASCADSFELNVSEIAERILYNISAVTLGFENDEGDYREETVMFNGDVQSKIQEAIQQQANQSFFCTSVSKQLTTNETTKQNIQNIITGLYRDVMAMNVTGRSVVLEVWEDPGAGWSDGGASLWEPAGVDLLASQVMQPEKGDITPGCVLYQEDYNVSFQRSHSWWRWEQPGVKGWKNLSDFRIESVTLQTMLLQYAASEESSDDVTDILYYNQTVDDPNLDDTLDAYRAAYPDTDSDKWSLITQGNQGTLGCMALVPGMVPDWVAKDAWSGLEEILDGIRTIPTDSSVNATNYPNPFLLLNKTRGYFLQQYDQQTPTYLQYQRYHPGDAFCSVGEKAVFCARKWFIDFVRNTTESFFADSSAQLTQALMDAIPDDAGFSAQNITQALQDASDAVKSQCTIPFGYPMMLSACDSSGERLWNESVRLAVDCAPKYLDPFEKTSWDGEELWTLKLRNRCILGPTGLPVLPPSPVTPWVVTINVWVIDVEGEYLRCKIIDTSDEAVFHPLLGHEAQAYVREASVVTVGNVTVGENTRMSFRFSTVAFGIVPSWGMMLGDLTEDWFDESTSGFSEE